MQVAAQREATARNLARSGVSPESGKSQALMAAGDIGAAKAAAGADYGARRGVETIGWARMADAANLGRGLPSAQATAASTGIQAGSGALSGAGAGLTAAQSGAGLMGQGFSTALSGQGQAGNLYGQAANIENTANRNNQAFFTDMANLGLKASGISDKTKKKNTGKKADGAKALDEINAVPVAEDWEYDARKGGPEDGIKRTGPMAQDVQAVMGEAAAPGGKIIDLVNMNGKLMASMQELTRRVKHIEGVI